MYKKPKILLLFVFILFFNFAARADQLGITTAGSTTYPTQGLRRVAKVVLSSDSYQGLYGAGIDTVNAYAYFGGREGSLSKINLTNFAEESTITLTSGGNFGEILVDSANGYAYFQSGGIHKVKLNGPGVVPVDEGVFLASTTVKQGVIDTSNPDPTKHYAYWISSSQPAVFYKYLLPPASAGDATMPTLVGGSGVTLSSPVSFPPSGNQALYGTIDTAAGYAYWGCIGTNKIVQIALNGANPPSESAVLTTGDVINWTYGRPSVDTSGAVHYAYFGTYNPSSITPEPADVDKINLSSFTEVSNTYLRIGTDACNGVNATEQSLSASVEDPASGYTIFVTDGVFPMKLFKMKNNAGDAAPAENSGPPLQLIGGYANTPTFPCDGDPGEQDNSPDNGVTFPYGEVYAQGSVIDNATGYAYIGCDSEPGQVIKIAFSQKAAIKGTMIIETQTETVNDIDFYSQAAVGNIRLAIYDNSSPQNLLWDSGTIANNVTNGWITENISTGVPASLTLTPGTYWLCWQTDSTLDIPSYTAGTLGNGFLIDQPFGAYPATLSNVSSTAETWSEYIDCSVSGQTPTYTPTATATDTITNTPTQTPSVSSTPTATGTNTAGPSDTNTPDWTLTATPTFTESWTISPTFTITETETPSETQSLTLTTTSTQTGTPSITLTSTYTPVFSVTATSTQSAQTPTAVPGTGGQLVSGAEVYPNPSNGRFTIKYILSSDASYASIDIYTNALRKILNLKPDSIIAGDNDLYVDLAKQNAAAGTYYYLLTVKGNNGKTENTIGVIILIK